MTGHLRLHPGRILPNVLRQFVIHAFYFYVVIIVEYEGEQMIDGTGGILFKDSHLEAVFK